MKVFDTDGDIDKVFASDARVHLELRDDGTAFLMIVDAEGPRVFDLLPASEDGQSRVVISESDPSES